MEWMNHQKRGLGTRVLLSASLGLSLLSIAVPAHAALPEQRTELKVLLLSATGTEPAAQAWESTFKEEGVPYDKWVLAPGHEPLTAESFADTVVDGAGVTRPHAKYQAVIVANGDLLYADGLGNYVSALSPDEWVVLNNYEATYGIRQVTGFVYPNPNVGLNWPTMGADLGGTTAQLTPQGLTLFSYLKGPIPIDVGTWGYYATPSDTVNFVTLVSSSTGASLVGRYKHPDTREELVLTVDQNAYHLHSRLLRHGMLNWVTRGVFLGYQRNYFTMHIDDVFMPNDRWDVATHSTIETRPIRMTPTHVTRVATWQIANGLKMDMLFNANGSVEAGANDALTRAFLLIKSQFRWMSHTYSHMIFDDIDEDPSNGAQIASLADILSEIQGNIDFATAKGLSIRANEIVNGGHSGLTLPDMATAFTQKKMVWVGDDNSRFPVQHYVGSALTIPRHPTNVYYNTSTRAEQLDEYNYLYLPPALGGVCQNTAVTTCFTAKADWNTYLEREAQTILSHALSNDPKPHYTHQSNLAGDGLVLLVTNAFLTKYRTYVKPALVNDSFSAMGNAIKRAVAWDDAKSAGTVNAYLQDGRVTIQSSATTAVSVPVSGTSIGSLYGGTQSGWQTVPAGATQSFTVLPQPLL